MHRDIEWTDGLNAMIEEVRALVAGTRWRIVGTHQDAIHNGQEDGSTTEEGIRIVYVGLDDGVHMGVQALENGGFQVLTASQDIVPLRGESSDWRYGYLRDAVEAAVAVLDKAALAD